MSASTSFKLQNTLFMTAFRQDLLRFAKACRAGTWWFFSEAVLLVSRRTILSDTSSCDHEFWVEILLGNRYDFPLKKTASSAHVSHLFCPVQRYAFGMSGPLLRTQACVRVSLLNNVWSLRRLHITSVCHVNSVQHRV